jgi:hypothetical protein
VIQEEHSNSFPSTVFTFGFIVKSINEFGGASNLAPNVTVDIHRFKIAPLNIVYYPLSDIHKDEIRKK